MLLLQPVVVDDALAADRSAPAEVQAAERAAEPPRWTGELLAQSSVDQRSPFGTNAPGANSATPDFMPPTRPGNQIGVDQPGGGPIPPPADPMAGTRISPPARPDAGPPPAGTTTVNPDRVTDVGAPPTTAPTTATPGATPSTGTPPTMPSTATPGIGPAPGSTPTPGMPPAGSGQVVPGVSSGASNTR
jgi:hypothetical protein